MVLFLVGIITTLTLVAKQTSDYVKSNISFTVVLEDSIANPDLQVLQTRLKTAQVHKIHLKGESHERAL